MPTQASPAASNRSRRASGCAVVVPVPRFFRRAWRGERDTSNRRPWTVSSTSTSGATVPGGRSVVTRDSGERPPGTEPYRGERQAAEAERTARAEEVTALREEVEQGAVRLGAQDAVDQDLAEARARHAAAEAAAARAALDSPAVPHDVRAALGPHLATALERTTP